MVYQRDRKTKVHKTADVRFEDFGRDHAITKHLLDGSCPGDELVVRQFDQEASKIYLPPKYRLDLLEECLCL